ncbi:MAG TPA: DnaA/Hda family protein [Burkholderiales bacterium]|nr:DnaA/Hda family protein [Burkholderiales bacterium]
MLESKFYMRQLPLEISPPAAPSLDNFVAGANAEALAAVRALAAGSLSEVIVYLWGERGSGRSHLLRAATRANPGLIAADDVETLDPTAQQTLFNAINAARDGGPAVLAAGGAPPGQLTLRDDVRSRLGWGLVYQLRAPGDAEKAGHLRAEAARRGLRLPEEVLAYLLNHLPRDLASLNAVLDALDRYSLASQRPLTLPLVREALQKTH